MCAGDICMRLQHLSRSACVTSRPWGQFLTTLNRNTLSITFTGEPSFFFIHPSLTHIKHLTTLHKSKNNFMTLYAFERIAKIVCTSRVIILTFALQDGETAKHRNVLLNEFTLLWYRTNNHNNAKWFTGWNHHRSIELFQYFERWYRLHLDILFARKKTWLPTSHKAWSSKHFLSWGGLQKFHLSRNPLNNDM